MSGSWFDRLTSGAHRPVATDVLRRTFDHEWPDFHSIIENLRTQSGTVNLEPERDTNDLVRESLELLRALSRDVSAVVAESRRSQNKEESMVLDGYIDRPLQKSPEEFADLVKRVVPGALVRHKGFGVGEVLEIRGTDRKSQAKVDFVGSSPKWLVLLFAPLEIVVDGS